MKLAISSKRMQIDKSNTTVVFVTALAAALTIFSLVGSKALLDQRSFQSRVITKKSAALQQLESNVQETQTLVLAYQEFVQRQENVIGGNSAGSGPRDGDNAKIVLDALPSKYDFPAVVTSIEKMLSDLNLNVESIAGVDDELTQAQNLGLVDPEPVVIPFSLEVSGNYESIGTLIEQLQQSIRPVQFTSLTLSSGVDTISLELSANTYYQPEKIVDIKTETVQ